MLTCKLFISQPMRDKGGNIRQLLEKNRERFHLSGQLYNIFVNTAEAIGE